MRISRSFFTLASVLALGGCITEEEKEKLEQAGQDLAKLANQIIVTYPAADSEVSDAVVIVKADIPSEVQAQSVILLVDGIEVGKDDNGEPWEISWPAYYWGDNNKHSLLLKATNQDGVEIRNQAMSVSVSSSVASSLTITSDQGSFNYISGEEAILSLAPVTQAKAYEVLVNDQEVQTQDPEVALTGLDVGTNIVSYRAILDNPSSDVFVGPYSRTVAIEVEKPLSPTINDADITSTESGYEVTLSWENVEGASEYQVLWQNADGATSELTTSDTAYVLTNVELGSYQWSVRQKNTVGHWSDYAEEQTIDVGVFRTQLGGSRDDRARQIITSRAGGYLIRAYTASYEITDTLQGSADDWIVRLDENGNVVDQYIENKSGRDRYRDMIEAVDGSIYLVGQDWETEKALIVKLDANLEPVWEIEVRYRPDTTTERYDFIAVTEWNSKLYVSAVEWASDGGSSWYLHEIDPATGSVSDAISLPETTGTALESIKVLIPQNDQLVLIGMAKPTDGATDNIFRVGAYVLRLSTSFQLVSLWDNTDTYKHIDVGNAIALASGRIEVIGIADPADMSIASVNLDGTGHRSYISDYREDIQYSGTTNLSQLQNGSVIGFFNKFDSNLGNRLLLQSFSENLTLVDTVYLDDLTGYVTEYGMVANPDDSITLLYGQGQNGYNNYDVIIQRIAPIN